MKQQTPPTSTEYVEPLGFKGTKGEWDYWEQQIRSKDGWHIANLNPYSPEKSNTEANAKLISQSKELAKLVQDFISVLDPLAFNPVHSNLMDKAKEILKQAGL